MTSFIHNKNSLIWAFNEAIDKDTKFDGNNSSTSIKQNIDIIKVLLSEKSYDSNITEELLNNYLLILNSNYLYTDIKKAINYTENNIYLFNGWREHAILLFWEKQSDNIYNFGIINCGEGADIQGTNNNLCNGIIIFKEINKQNIDNFLDTYNNYNINTVDDYNFDNNKLYTIFYFILFDKLLGIPNSVDFTKIDKKKVDFYKIESQLIGSCAFTNLINLIYYMYVKEQNGTKSHEECYTNYLVWYNKSKDIIKKKYLMIL